MSGTSENKDFKQAPLGARNLSKALAGLKLNPEMIDYLTEINGELMIILSPHAAGPSAKIVDADNNKKTLANTKEFEKLSNYKAIIGGKIELNKKDAELRKEIALYKNTRNEYNQGPNNAPARMLEANEQRFRQFLKQYELVDKQIEVIMTLPEGNEKNYLITKGTTLKQIIVDCQVSCMGDTKFETEIYLEKLLNCGIPRWIEKKFGDANFTKDVRTDARPLLFSKGNYMKSIGLTKKEATHPGFLAANEFIIGGSHAIISMIDSKDLEDWFLDQLEGDEDLLKENYDKFFWPMMGNGDFEEFLEPRLNRNKINSFTPTQAPKPKPGQANFRPETANQREIREMNNKLGLLVSTIVDFFHFIPRVDDPLTDMWFRVMNTTNWVVTPENHLYKLINEAPNRDVVLNHIRMNSLGLTKRIMKDICLINLKIPEASARGRALANLIVALPQNDTRIVYTDLNRVATAIGALTALTREQMENVDRVVDGDTEAISLFRGKATTDVRKDQKEEREVIKNLKEAAPKVAKELKRITDRELRESIGDWIKTNFRHKKLQLLAAQRAIAAVGDKNLGYEEIEYHSESDSSDSDSN